MPLTVQVAPEDCTGCGLCVDVCPAKSKEEAKHKAINMQPKLDHLRRASGPTGTSSSTLPELDRTALEARARSRARSCSSRCSSSPAPAPAAARRPYLKLMTQLFGDRAADRQRHRLLLDLRRQPADHALDASTPRAAARPGPTRCSRTTPSSASACGWPSTSSASYARDLLERLAPTGRRGAGRGDSSTPTSTTEERHPRSSGSASATLKERLAAHRRRPRPAQLAGRGRRPGAEERLDRRRRRLGLRHRLRRPRPRAGLGPQRQHPGARHRGLLEHRRPGVEGDAARRRGQVRRRRQGDRQEGPRA